VSAFASKLKTWQVQTAAAYADGRFENTVVSNQGAIRLAHLLKPLALPKVDATHVWDIVEDAAGNLILATGGDGKLLRLAPSGQIATLHETKVGPVLSLAQAPDGTVFAGTGPDGRILQMSPRGEVKTFCETGENYIWSLVYQAESRSLFAATGPKGRILRISPEGKSEVFFDTKQEHVLCLAGNGDGMLYAGTDKRGLIYRIDPRGKGFVLFETPQKEVRSLLVTPEAVYAGTSAPTRKRGSSPSNGPPGPAVSVLNLPKPNAMSTAKPVAETPSVVREASKDNDRSVAASAPSSAGSGENSVYRISPEGAVREVFREKALMLTLLKVDGKLLVGTGMDGRLFEVDEVTRDFTEIARPDVGQILRLMRRADGSVVVGTGDAGHLLVVQQSLAPKGTAISEVFDAKLISKWGAFTWRADVPKGSALSFATRGGNTSEPDATWSDWSAESFDSCQGNVYGTVLPIRAVSREFQLCRRQSDARSQCGFSAVRHREPSARSGIDRSTRSRGRRAERPKEGNHQMESDRSQ
jgi:outer membrane protein assembly factor BamB